MHGSEPGMRWDFEEWGATAVISGHDHAYERVMRDDNGDGILLPYFTTGLGGHSRYSFGTPVGGSAVRYSADFGTMIIDASDTQIDFEFWSVAGGGRLIDSYGITSTGEAPILMCSTAGRRGRGRWRRPMGARRGRRTPRRSRVVRPTSLPEGSRPCIVSAAAGVPVGHLRQRAIGPATGAEMGLEFGKGGLAAGGYAVRLFMRKRLQGTDAVGDRVFDVRIEGEDGVQRCRPVARFGHKAGGMLEWRGTVTDGRVDIDFPTWCQNPLINGVEILAVPDMLV